MRILGIVALCAALGGCAAAPQMVWVRIDGQDIRANPVLLQTAEIDRTVCLGELQKANVSGVTLTNGGLAGAVAAAERSNAVGQIGVGCMAGKGYVQVTEDQREAKIAELASIADLKKQQEAAAAAPSPKPRKPMAKPGPPSGT
jgi:hypothetical protein